MSSSTSMKVVAVAGGTGGLGRALIEGIQARGTQEVVVLSRKANPTLEAELKVRIVPVDYTNVNAMTTVFEENNISVVISTLSFMPGSGDNNELNLIKAADASSKTMAFIPSNWGVPLRENDPMPIADPKKANIAYLRDHTTLKYAEVHNGYFLDYFGMPKVPSYINPFTIVIDMAHNAAAIPGDGNTPVTLTHTRDVGRYVAALLDTEPHHWPANHVVTIQGQTITWNAFLAIAEDVKGQKFKTVYDGPEMYENGKASELPAHVKMYPFFPKEVMQGMLVAFNTQFANGWADLSRDINTKDGEFAKIEPWGVRDVLEMGWEI